MSMLHKNAASDGSSLAVALGWSTQDLQARKISSHGAQLNLARGLQVGKPAALFATVEKRNGVDPLWAAAKYGYHSGVDWGILSSDSGIRVFNSHRLVGHEWLAFPEISWDKVEDNKDLLNCFTPEEVIEEKIETFANRLDKPTRILEPIDDSLVRRLDLWRDQALRYSKKSDAIDEKLQSLYSQLFVLRAVEDRKLDPKISSLREVIQGSDSINRDKWISLFDQARSRIGSDLFSTDFAQDIPQHVLAGVINDLYRPSHLAGIDIEYDFSWIEADVLGTAYEKYLSTVLEAGSAPSQMELFNTPEREVSRYSARKKSGTYYTPPFMHDYIAAKCVGEYFDKVKNTEPPRVIDFACGSGSFLVAAIDEVLKLLKARDPQKPWAKILIGGRFIAGVDIDPKAVSIARLRLWHRLVEEPDALPLPSLSEIVISADGLRSETWGKLDQPYDIVLGNPPFLKTSLVEEKDDLSDRFKTAKGRFDFSHLFAEQAIKVLAPGGILGLVLPNRILQSASAQTLRAELISSCSIQTIVDFGSNRPFRDVSAYVMCLIAQVLSDGTDKQSHVRVVEVESISADFISSILLKADSERWSRNGFVLAYDAKQPNSSSPWLLLSASDEKARIALSEFAVPLSEVATVNQGIKTGANDVFLFEPVAVDGTHLSQVVNGMGEEALLESELLHPVIFGAEIRRSTRVRSTKLILYPYRDGRSLPDGQLAEEFPKTWEYLKENHGLLSSRSSVSGGVRWYELIRPRNIGWLSAPKLVMRDLALRPSFGIDIGGQVFLIGGTAVTPFDPDFLLPLMAYLNSSAVDRLISKTTPQFGGNFRKYEPRHIESIPILTSVIEEGELRDHLRDLALKVLSATKSESSTEIQIAEDEIDDILVKALAAHGIEIG
ncbi:N-6 DNA methylase [Pararhodobacter sp. CCB-MM2]|uniref:Eco57I restriction-modification methylase domain-containing protein n=1 Tax=Pararhodobacter sp. CCB-MM2 TaxID=1786003 RepID=UPI0013149D2B|nr:N-6 DNA methylase [Pararhodobacter sp. CCB-MM2]